MCARDEVQDAVLALVSSVIPSGRRVPKPLAPELSLRRDLGLDSLRLVALVVQFEERLGVNLGQAGNLDVAKIQTIGDVVELARGLLSHSGVRP